MYRAQIRMTARPGGDDLAVADRAGGATAGVAPPLVAARLQSESDWYLAHRWCLNPFPSLADLSGHLCRQLHQVGAAAEGWQRDEATTNVLLMSCAIADTIDDYFQGTRYNPGKTLAFVPATWPLVRAVSGLLALWRAARAWHLRDLASWRRNWGDAIEKFATAAVVTVQRDAIEGSLAQLRFLLRKPFPSDLRARRPRIPGAFRRHDLSHFDVLALARKFAAADGRSRRPLLVLAVRTAGSYFAPLVMACLRAEGYADIDSVSIHPKKGVTPWETARIARCAARGGQVVIVDEPLDTGATLEAVVGILRRAGVGTIAALLPVHPRRRDWSAELARSAIGDIRIVRLEPEEWHKHRLLAADAVERRLRPYFLNMGYRSISVVNSRASATFDEMLARASGEYFGSRLKRVHEVHLVTANGSREVRFVLAKSVGWGWLAYHAFLAADALAPFTAPVLGLRDGILYMEWLPQVRAGAPDIDREKMVRTIASYVAARARLLKLPDDPCADLSRRRHHDGIELLANMLGRAYGSRVVAALRGPRIRHELAGMSGPAAALIDGRMHPDEWIGAGGALLKTDFEHHGLGKSALNMTDPACDLADAILGFGLSRREERSLIAHYASNCADHDIEERLILGKILAGCAAMTAARACLADPRLASRHAAANRRYLQAWRFLTVQVTHYCGKFVRKAARIRWRSPLMVLDLDGVVDHRRFGFPCTTASGIEALSLLHAHEAAIALNTARAIGEAKEYCDAYGCAGAVAEYGSVAWDAVGGHEQVLASAASLRQLENLRGALRGIPGAHLDDAYRYSIRVYRFEGDSMAPLPAATIENLLGRLGADEVTVRHTTIDTAIHARAVDKGSGLRALLELAGAPGLETVAVGDSEPDLAMFRAAWRCFAPANILCRKAAVENGCQIVGKPYQRGLLEVARRVLHPDGKRCALCRPPARSATASVGLFPKLLRIADRGRGSLLLRALTDPMAIRAFVASE